jgi:AcrR family transcriptional regulator
MGRPREFSLETALGTAKQLFWERGYAGTSLADLETSTGLTRSSLYQAFGSKEALFAQVLALYIETFVDPLLAGMERPGAEPGDIQDFFHELGNLFLDDTALARRGCLWVNTIAEFSGRDPNVDSRAAEYEQRLRGAFANALRGWSGATAADPLLIERRSRMLMAATVGIWLSARVDCAEAVRACAAASAEAVLAG